MRMPDDNGSKRSGFFMTLGGLNLLIALGIVGLQAGLLVKTAKGVSPLR
jgi:hypothetical protein